MNLTLLESRLVPTAGIVDFTPLAAEDAGDTGSETAVTDPEPATETPDEQTIDPDELDLSEWVWFVDRDFSDWNAGPTVQTLEYRDGIDPTEFIGGPYVDDGSVGIVTVADVPRSSNVPAGWHQDVRTGLWYRDGTTPQSGGSTGYKYEEIPEVAEERFQQLRASLAKLPPPKPTPPRESKIEADHGSNHFRTYGGTTYTYSQEHGAWMIHDPGNPYLRHMTAAEKAWFDGAELADPKVNLPPFSTWNALAPAAAMLAPGDGSLGLPRTPIPPRGVISTILWEKLAEAGRNGTGGGETVRVYRVEGTPNTRVVIGENGEVVIVDPHKTLYLNFGDRARAEAYLAQKLNPDQKMGPLPGAEVKSFEVPKSLVDELRALAVTEADLAANPSLKGRPLVSDPTKTPDSFGLRPEQIDILKQLIVPGSGQTGLK